MEWLTAIATGKVVLLTLILTRVSGLMMTAPIYGSNQVPMQIRALLAFAMSLLILPAQWHVEISDPGSLVNYLALLGTELAIGVWLGLAIHILFSGVELAGQVIGRVSGEMMAETYDPTTDENSSVLSQLFQWVGLAVFLCIGGHRMVMAGLLDTFRTIPPGGAGLPDSVRQTCEVLLTQSVSLGIQAAAPVLTALLLATVVVGLVGRTMPQLNVLALGFSFYALVMFGVLIVSLGSIIWVFQDQVEPILKRSSISPLHGDFIGYKHSLRLTVFQNFSLQIAQNSFENINPHREFCLRFHDKLKRVVTLPECF